MKDKLIRWGDKIKGRITTNPVLGSIALAMAFGLVGSVDTLLLLSISSIRMSEEWSEQLVNGEIHQPLWTGAVPTVIVLCVVGVIGYLILSNGSLKKLPPLVTVLSISAMYLGMLECILWMVQTMCGTYWLLSLFPANCIVIGIKTIRYKIWEWNQMEKHSDTQQEDGYPGKPVLHLVIGCWQKRSFGP